MDTIYRESCQTFFIKSPRKLKGHVVRVWREVEHAASILPLHDEDIAILLVGLCEDNPNDLEGIARALLGRERVNAVEVKDKAGNGGVLYRTEQVYEAGGRLIRVI